MNSGKIVCFSTFTRAGESSRRAERIKFMVKSHMDHLPPNVLQNIMVLLNSHKERSHLGRASKTFLETLLAFRAIYTEIPKQHRKQMISVLFEELTEELSEKFFEKVPDSFVPDDWIDITRFERELHILDVSRYDEMHSRKIVVKKHRYYVEATYEIPIGESSRTEHEMHRLVFKAPRQYGKSIAVIMDEDSWSSESPCELMCSLLGLPWA